MTKQEHAIFRCIEIREQIHLRHQAISEMQDEVQELFKEHDRVALIGGLLDGAAPVPDGSAGLTIVK